MNARIKDTDHGFAALKIRMAKAAQGARLTVGIHEAEAELPAEGDDSGATLGDVAAFNEFGGADGNPPRRSFLADWADQNQDQNQELFRRSVAAVVKGKLPSVDIAMQRLGVRFVAEIQQRIRAGIEPANAESTVERKGSSTPLVDTGQLWSSITFQVGSGSTGQGNE